MDDNKFIFIFKMIFTNLKMFHLYLLMYDKGIHRLFINKR